MGKVSEAVAVVKITELLKKLNQEQLDYVTDKIKIRLAHMLKSNLVSRKANPQEWKELKRLCKEIDTIGLMMAAA